jgi:hypothetical protein
MKKRLLFVAAIFAATATFAQDGLTSKKGEAYLPEAGDFALGFDANPFLNYAGNLFNGNTGNSIGAGATWFAPNMAIYGKMFKDEKTAYRAMVRLGFGSNTQNSIANLFETPSALETKEFTNEVKSSYNNIVLGAGIEKRRGNTRIQGIYGGQLIIGFGGSSTETSYGLALNDSTVSANGSDIYALDGNGTGATSRTTEAKNGSTFMLGIAGFVGVEWFFAPKVSLGAEYTWGLSMNSTGEGETTTERWGVAPGGTTNSLITKTSKTGKSSSFGIDNGISGARVSINFHF